MKTIDEQALKQIVQDILGMGIRVQMKNEPMGFAVAYLNGLQHPAARGARGEIKIGQLRKIGEDETILRDTNTDAPYTEYIRYREGTISFRFESDSGSLQTVRAMDLAETVRNAFYETKWRDRLREECNFAIGTMQDIEDLDYSWDNRQIDVAILDVQINHTYSTIDADPDYFTKVNDDMAHIPEVTPQAPVLDSTELVSDIAGGVVVVRGSRFTELDRVVIDDVPHAPIAWSDTWLAVAAPAHVAGTATLLVRNPYGGDSEAGTLEYFTPRTLSGSVATYYAEDFVASGDPFNDELWFADSMFILYCYPDVWRPIVRAGATYMHNPRNLTNPFPPPAGVVFQCQQFDSEFTTAKLTTVLPGDDYFVQITGSFDPGQTTEDSDANETSLICTNFADFSVWASKIGGNTIRVAHNGGPSIGVPFTPHSNCTVQVRYLHATQTLQIRLVDEHNVNTSWTIVTVAPIATKTNDIFNFTERSSIVGYPLPMFSTFTGLENSFFNYISFRGFTDDPTADKLLQWAAQHGGIMLTG